MNRTDSGIIIEPFDYSRGRQTNKPTTNTTNQEETQETEIEELKKQGYTQEGNYLYSPQQKYLSYRDKKYKNYSYYSPTVIILDSQGRITQEINYAPKIEDVNTGGTTWWTAKRTKIKTYDYNQQTIITEDINNKTQTTLAMQQKITSEIKRGVRTSEPTIETIRKQTKTIENKPDKGFRRVDTGEGYIAAYTGDTSAFYGSRLEREEYLKNPESYQQKKYFESVKKRSQKLNEEGYYTGEEIIKGKVTKNESSNDLYNNNRFDNLDSYSNIPEQIKKENAFHQRIDNIVRYQKDVEQRQEKLLQGFGYRKDGNFLKNTAAVILATPTLSTVGFAEQIISSITKVGFLAEGQIRSEYRQATIKASNEAITETPNLVIQSFNPTTETGLVNLALLPIGLRTMVGSKSQRFINQQSNKPISTIKGKTYFGIDKNEQILYGSLERKTPQLSVTIPERIPIQKVVTETDNVRISIAKNKDTNIVTLPDGQQISVTIGTGAFKKYSLQTTINAQGRAKTTVFKLTRNGLKPVQKYNFKSQQGILFTEQIPELIDTPMDLKLEGYTQRVRRGISTSQGIPLSRKGQVPIGKVTSSSAQLVQVGTETKYLSIKADKRNINIATRKTEFEIVDYPVAQKTTKLNLDVDTEKTLSAELPTTFITKDQQRAAQIFKIEFQELGKPPKIKNLAANKLKSLKTINEYEKGYYPSLLEETKPYTGKGVQNMNVEGFSNQNLLLEQLTKFDPHGLSQDRLRMESSIMQDEIINKISVRRPTKQNITIPKLTMRTDIVPRINSRPIISTLGLIRSIKQSRQIPQTKLTPITSNLIKNKPYLKNEPFVSNKIFMKEKTLNLVREKSITQTKTLTKQLAKTKTLIKAKIETNPRIGIRTPNPKTPRTNNPPMIPRLDYKKHSSKSSEVYDVYVRETKPKDGKKKPSVIKVSDKPLPKNAALNLGSFYVDNTSARSFKITNRGKTRTNDDEQLFFEQYKYRNPKSKSRIDPKNFIEKEAYLIDTSGELAEITAKGLKAKQQKRSWF